MAEQPERISAIEIFRVFLGLGLTSFGGPVAHLGYFRNAFVERRNWLDERSYADLVALCQFLPGPASSQVGIGIGLAKGGLPGALAAWVGFTAPSAIALTLFALGVAALPGGLPEGVLHGLLAAVVAVVAHAVLGMGRSLCPDRMHLTLALVAAMVLLFGQTPEMQIAVIAAGAAVGALFLPAPPDGDATPLGARVGRRTAIVALTIFFFLLAALPALALAADLRWLELVDSFYRAGSLVFGGGHVVLPLLESEIVGPGRVSEQTFLAGYGAAQAVPGPLFTFASYLGAAMALPPNGWAGAAICTVAIFVPSFLLVVGVLPFWDALRRHARARCALAGVNAAVVGLLLAALYDPVWTSAVRGAPDAAMAMAAWLLLVVWCTPPWAVVTVAAAAGWVVL